MSKIDFKIIARDCTERQADIALALSELVFEGYDETYGFINVCPSDLIYIIEDCIKDKEGEWIWTSVPDGDYHCDIFITVRSDFKIQAHFDLWRGTMNLWKMD